MDRCRKRRQGAEFAGMGDFSGGAGNESYTGTADQDFISGGAGADTLKGLAGDDYIASDDRAPNFGVYYGRAISIDTGAEQDTIQAGDGDDHIYAGYGDNVDGGGNTVYGDYLSISFMGASAGITVDFSLASQVIGGGTIKGIENLTWVQGSNFADTIYARDNGTGYAEFNKVYGMGGNDRLYAGYYTSVIDGGDGDDYIDATASQYLSEVHGGAGKDTILLNSGQGWPVFGEDGDDTITAGGEIHGGNGNDTIHVNTSNYPGYVFGDAGDDVIEASEASVSYIYGGDGKDTITGGAYRDLLATGNGPAWIQKEIYDDTDADKDTVDGAGGNDLIAAGIGDDVDGGTGDDTLRLSLAGSAVGVTVTTSDILSGVGTVLGGTIRNVEHLQWLGGSNYADSFVVRGTNLPTTIDGGAGADRFSSNGLEVILLGGEGNDRLSSTAAGGFFDGGAGKDSADFSRAKAGVTVTMVDGYGGGFIGGNAQLQNVEKVTGSAFADTMQGDSLANTLLGGGGDDQLNGGDGKDTLDGGAGADTLTGGLGNDTYVVTDALDTIVEAAGEGADLVKASVSYTLAANVENLTLTSMAAIDGTGNAQRNVLIGNGAANTLLGLGGNDVLVGGGGADHLDGGDGSDVYVVASAAEFAGAVIADTGAGGIDELRYAARTAGTFTLVAGGSGIDAVVIGTGSGAVADRTGTAAINVDASGFGKAIRLYGNAGANVLTGTDLADIIDGGAGADAMKGGAGSDSYSVDNAGDVVTELSGGGTDTVLATIDYTLGDNVENLTLDGLALKGTGNGLANTITGNGLANLLDGGDGNDTLLGGDGADRLTGGAGADRMEGGNGDDTYITAGTGDTLVENAAAGFDRAFGGDSFTLGDNIEVGSLTGANAASLTGSGTDNVLGGNSANNTISGGGGADSLLGHAGADTLNGGDGDDFLFGGQGIDTMTGGAGKDQFVISTGFGQNADKITDFVSGTDKIMVVNDYVSGYLLAGGLAFGTSARDEDDIAIYDRGSGQLWVDYDANGPQAKVLLATFTPGTNIVASDFLLIDTPSFNYQIAQLENVLVL
ncbi:beta strand repeat-containing protein [Novosphingobium cyanobacteriorum]|uniref:Calcium-binding protein n=1 Tax=Novosphingobium cyanobacteriorum TaxID=3024215 RepID=A0ABT6CMJ5_9SPHN|nr:calcium-binding protein [Novosphingobium cyanobacteriorum]MDF8335139.1 calcium-binding protein [Novosphingobium cyanobacteriorum]